MLTLSPFSAPEYFDNKYVCKLLIKKKLLAARKGGEREDNSIEVDGSTLQASNWSL